MLLNKNSVVVTVLNEGVNINNLLDSIHSQTIKATEVIVVDAGSTDDTKEKIKKHKQKVKLLVRKGISRSRARNLGVRIAKNNIIVMTDAGCIAKKDWLKIITKPLTENKADVVAGFYDMVGKTKLQKIMAIYLGVLPQSFDNSFLPSTRSVAFTKSTWKRVGGFPENLNDTAEDTVFNQKLLEEGVKIVRVKNARVEWRMPTDLREFAKKIFKYAKGDAQSKIFWNPVKQFSSHNIKAFFVLVRTVVGFVFLFLAIFSSRYFPIFLALCFGYIIFSILKVYKKTKKWGVAIYGPLVQFTADVAVSLGFIRGIL